MSQMYDIHRMHNKVMNHIAELEYELKKTRIGDRAFVQGKLAYAKMTLTNLKAMIKEVEKASEGVES